MISVLQKRAFMSRDMTKPTKWVCAQWRIRSAWGIRPVWSESSLSAWRKLGSLATHWPHSEDSDETGRMPHPRLRWAHSHFVGFVMLRLSYVLSSKAKQHCQHWPWLPTSQKVLVNHGKVWPLHGGILVNLDEFWLIVTEQEGLTVISMFKTIMAQQHFFQMVGQSSNQRTKGPVMLTW